MDKVTGSSALMSLIFGWMQNKCLVSCSQVNMLWHCESCRLLWKHQCELSDVIGLLRPDSALLSPVERRRVASGSISLVRFSHYSRWISHLSCGILKGTASDLKDAFLISKETLFPSLENLTLTKIDQGSGMCALPLLRPRVKVLQFYRGISTETVVLILSHLEGIPLRELCVPVPLHVPSVDDRLCLLDMLNCQQALTHLTLHPNWVDIDIFYVIAFLPELFMLEISESEITPLGKNTIRDGTILGQLEQRRSMFPSLKRLTFCSYCPYAVWTKISEIIFTETRLSVVNLTLTDMGDAILPADLAIFPQSGSSLADLTKITASVAWDDGSSRARATARTLEPLSDCYLLQNLYLRTPQVPYINDGELLSLAKNWPNLTDLHFADVAFVGREDTYGLSLNMLVKIPAICPKLSSLTLTCSSSIEFEPVKENLPATLEVLDLGLSFLLDSQLVDWHDRLILIEAYLALVLPPSCTLKFDVDYSHLEHQMSDSEWSQLTTAHQLIKTTISHHRAAIRVARKLKMQLGIPPVSP